MISIRALSDELARYEPADAGERRALARIQELVRGAENPFTRANTDHVTGSTVVARPDGSAFLMVYHRHLDRWLQPGGHVEPGDTSVLETALREAREETGVSVLTVANGGGILDVDVHPIPPKGNRPAHVHYDLRFLATTREQAHVAEPSEIAKVAWFPFAEALSNADESLSRALRKAHRLLAPDVDSGQSNHSNR